MRFIQLLIVAAFLLGSPLRATAQTEDNSDTLAALVSLLKESDDPQFHLDILKGMNDALKGRTNVKMPAGWADIAPKLAKSENAEVRNLTQSLSTLFGDVASMDKLKGIVADGKADLNARRQALRSLLDAKTAGLGPLLLELLDDPAMRGDAMRGLAAYEDPRTPGVLIELLPKLRPEEKLAAFSTLAAHEEWALKLLEALKAGTIPRTDLTAATIRQLSELGSEPISAWIKANWGEVRTSPAEKLTEIENYKKILAAAEAKGVKADARNGRAVFSRVCAQCHILFDAGGKVGPDLTGSGRAEADYILQNVVDPNAVIGKDYQMSIIRMKGKGRRGEGRLVNGIISREDDHTLTVATDTETLMLPKNEILRMKLSEVSMMPEGLLQALTEQEFLDLIAYLRGPSQVPLPEGYIAPPPAAPAQ